MTGFSKILKQVNEKYSDEMLNSGQLNSVMHYGYDDMRNTSSESKIKLDAFSLASVRVHPCANSISLGRPATAFYYAHKQKIYLVSNWHVFSGRNRFNNAKLSVAGVVPESFMLDIFPRSGDIHLADFDDLCPSGNSIELELIGEHREAKWLQHQEFGQGVDIALIELPPELLQSTRWIVGNACTETSFFDRKVGSGAFVVGFPGGISVGRTLPIWKSATIASEPMVPCENQIPRFLLDGLMVSGMSGSPVYCRNSLVSALTKIEGVEMNYTLTQLIGVYSGRIKQDGQPTSLGEIWDAKLIAEIIENGVSGSHKSL